MSMGRSYVCQGGVPDHPICTVTPGGWFGTPVMWRVTPVHLREITQRVLQRLHLRDYKLMAPAVPGAMGLFLCAEKKKPTSFSITPQQVPAGFSAALHYTLSAEQSQPSLTRRRTTTAAARLDTRRIACRQRQPKAQGQGCEKLFGEATGLSTSVTHDYIGMRQDSKTGFYIIRLSAITGHVTSNACRPAGASPLQYVISRLTANASSDPACPSRWCRSVLVRPLHRPCQQELKS